MDASHKHAAVAHVFSSSLYHNTRRHFVKALLAVATILMLSSRMRISFADAWHRVMRTFSAFLVRTTRPVVRKDFLSAVAAPALDSNFAAEGQRHWTSPEMRDPMKLKAVRFKDLYAAFPSWLALGLQHQGYDAMKPIQQKVLPLALAGRDVVGIAPTGSGKTLAFLVPAIVHAAGQRPPRRLADGPLVLVLAPTRELAVQIGSVAEQLLRPSWDGKGYSGQGEGLSMSVLYGGTRRVDQLQVMRRQRLTHLVVATPGRLLDLVRNFNAFGLRFVSLFILDEGDRMLDLGFEQDISDISDQIRCDRQMFFFSATWPPSVEQAASRLCAQGAIAERVCVGPVDSAGPGRGLAIDGSYTLPPKEIRQIVEVINVTWGTWDGDAAIRHKLPLLLKYLEEALGQERDTKARSMGLPPPPEGKAIIFVSTRRAAEELGSAVAQHFGLDRCGVMHGQRKQDQRESTLSAFRQGRLRALVTTDVLGRGVDIPGVSHVVIFDFPDRIETYVHRVGRTGRNGRPGTSIAFFEPQPWSPDLPRELAEVLQACGQEVPLALVIEDEINHASTSDGYSWNNFNPTNGGACPGSSSTSGLPLPWTVVSCSDAPPLDSDGGPALATEEEMGQWHAEGARVWGYSANGGITEQGRLEFRTGGRLRTSWSWGTWHLLSSGSSAEESGGPDAQHMSISWGGCQDVMMLDATGLSCELVSRNGRPASTYRKKTLGRALPGASL